MPAWPGTPMTRLREVIARESSEDRPMIELSDLISGATVSHATFMFERKAWKWHEAGRLNGWNARQVATWMAEQGLHYKGW